MSSAPSLVIVSGRSGAGRTTAMKALEDLGFYCVDNLPVVLLDRFVDLFSERESRLAVGIDVREGSFLDDFASACDALQTRGIPMELIYLDASDEVLALRFGETRRVHPLAAGDSLRAGISRERKVLEPVAARADLTIDTSTMSVHDLKREVTRRFTGGARAGGMRVELISFGFRSGTPEIADLMIDVRFLPNPNFEPELKHLTGRDEPVAAYVLQNPRTVEFLERLFSFVEYLLPLYEHEGKAYLTIAIGCTGGQHRSVAVTGALERFLRERKIDVAVTHRDISRNAPDHTERTRP